jgi:hypothetical protein
MKKEKQLKCVSTKDKLYYPCPASLSSGEGTRERLL